MRFDLQDDSAIKRYLLGELAEDDQQKLEQRLLTDNEYFERLELVEDELVDDYASGALTADEREKYHSYFLSTPERREKTRFAGALRKYVSAKQSETVANERRMGSPWQVLVAGLRGRSPVLGYSLAAALLIIALGGPWLMIRTARLQEKLESTSAQYSAAVLQLEDQRARGRQLARELENERSRSALPATLSLVLTPSLVRGGESTNKATVTPGINLIRLELQIPEDQYRGYRAAIHNDDGAEILVQNMLKARSIDGNPAVVVNLPADSLPRGDYYAKLSGTKTSGNSEDLGKYYFRVVKE